MRCLRDACRREWAREFVRLRENYPKLIFPESVADGDLHPPSSPDDCLFARTTMNLTADLKGKIVPCQFGGTPDCSQCGCMASAGIAAVGKYKLFNILPLRHLYDVSDRTSDKRPQLNNWNAVTAP